MDRREVMTGPARPGPPLRPPPGGKGPSVWQFIGIAIGALIVIGIIAGALGGGGKKSTPVAKPDCGTPSPQDTVGVVTAYLDGPGSPIVAGKPGCARIAALWARLQVARKAKVAPYVALERAAARAGWKLVDSEDPRWRHGNAAFVRSAFTKAGDGQDPLFVFVRPGAAVVFNDLEP